MRIAIIGNSGSGKSTLARLLGKGEVPTLDLDTIVWEPNQIAVARDRTVALTDLHAFCSLHTTWILEGCYAFCAQAALAYDPELIWLDPGLDACLQNCRNRPWEPHKYASKAEQDEKLPFLLDWAAAYYTREDDMSQHAHRALFDSYDGPKRLLTSLKEC